MSSTPVVPTHIQRIVKVPTTDAIEHSKVELKKSKYQQQRTKNFQSFTCKQPGTWVRKTLKLDSFIVDALIKVRTT